MSNFSGACAGPARRVIEVPIEWQNKTDSRVRKRDMMRMVAGLFRARLGS